MKAALYLFFLVTIFSCEKRNLSNSKEEKEYQEFASLTKEISAKSISPNSKEMREKILIESGFNDIKTGIIKNAKTNELSSDDLWNFYQDVVLIKYKNDPNQALLRLKTISYAVNSFDLLSKADEKSRHQVLIYTRDIVDNLTEHNFQLSLDCLIRIRDLVDKEQFNEMVKIERFKIRIFNESISKDLSTEIKGRPDWAVKAFQDELEKNKMVDSGLLELIRE